MKKRNDRSLLSSVGFRQTGSKIVQRCIVREGFRKGLRETSRFLVTDAACDLDSRCSRYIFC